MIRVSPIPRAFARITTPRAFGKNRFIHTAQLETVKTLPDDKLETFRKHAFNPSQPFILPRGSFYSRLAASQWFNRPETAPENTSLNTTYLEQYGDTVVPLELTHSGEDGQTYFARMEQPLTTFLTFMDAARRGRDGSVTARSPESSNTRSTSIYLAQCPLPTLPAALLADLPTPEIVQLAGRGDVYDSSIWIGYAPTYTPLHRDPNPNLFVQLAGKKVVRIFEPAVGDEMFAEARRRISDSNRGSARMRGEEMMQGEEKRVLEELVWGDGALGYGVMVLGQQAELAAGDGMFIPKGWWHSIKGVGQGVVGSVNWWFR